MSHASVKSHFLGGWTFWEKQDRVSDLMSHNSDAWNRFLPGPGATFLHQESPGAVRASCRARHRFVYVLKPTSRARQESPMSTPITRQRIPSHGDISHCCLLKSCHYIAPCSSVNEFLKNPEMSNAEEFQRCLRNVCFSPADCLGTGLSPVDSFHSTNAAATVEPIQTPSKSVALSWVLDRLYYY